MRWIELECCGQFDIYGRLGIILFLIAIVAITLSSW